jgi:hypothetical protein
VDALPLAIRDLAAILALPPSSDPEAKRLAMEATRLIAEEDALERTGMGRRAVSWTAPREVGLPAPRPAPGPCSVHRWRGRCDRQSFADQTFRHFRIGYAFTGQG